MKNVYFGRHFLLAALGMVAWGALGFMTGPVAVGQTAGALANGMSAQAASRGGIMAAEQGDPLDAVQGNPAGLGGIHACVLDLSAIGVFASGSFRNSVDANGKLNGVGGVLPYGAFAMPLGSSRWTASLAVAPDALMRVSWKYIDPPGTAGVSYGEQQNKSQIASIRSSVGLARPIGSKWTAGATFGLDYNPNTLEAPYIFQQQPELEGLKVLLDLHTHGVGWNGSAGVQVQPTEHLRAGIAWKSPTFIQTHGTASGTASALFAALGVEADPTFNYRAEVDNELPQSAAAGLSWQVNRRMRWGLQGDWVNWATAFRRLPVKLTDGSNVVINSVAGSSSIQDQVPLHWRNQGVARVGVEVPLTRGWVARGGYSYMSNPVPDSTLTPLTAGILRNALTAGAGWSRERWQWDAAYQAQLPASASVGQSSLEAGEYDNSHVSVMTQSLTVSTRFHF